VTLLAGYHAAAVDVVARLVAEGMKASSRRHRGGERPGAAGAWGRRIDAQPADGYTVVLSRIPLVIAGADQRSRLQDADDYDPFINLSRIPMIRAHRVAYQSIQ